MTQHLYSEIKIVIADDHEIFRDGLIAVFENEEKFNIIDQVANGVELIQSVRLHQPDVILVDIEMPKMGGIEATRTLRKEFPSLGILALSFRDDDDSIIDMIEAGANGYLIKSALKQELIEGVATVFHGSNYYCRNTQTKFADLLRTRNFDRHNINKRHEFTPRELEIIKLICKEYIAKQIADALGTSKRTIENQKLKIQEKMGVHTTGGIILYAVKHKLVSLE